MHAIRELFTLYMYGVTDFDVSKEYLYQEELPLDVNDQPVKQVATRIR